MSTNGGSQNCINQKSSVDEAIKAACAALGRQPGQGELELAERLNRNWYSCAADVASMSDDEAAALDVPLKLKSTIAAMLSESITQHRPPAFEAVATALPAAAADLLAANSLPETAINASAAAATDVNWETLPVEERVCPPLDRFGFKFADIPKVTTRKRVSKYALGKTELTPRLQADFEGLHKFGTERFFGAQQDPIAAVTAEKYAAHLRGVLGYLHRVKEVPLEELSLASAVPSSAREGVSLAFEYIQWLVKERGINVQTEMLVWRSVLHAAKYLYHAESAVVRGSGDQPYSDLAVVKEIRANVNAARKNAKVAPRVSDESVKWLDWPDYLRLCQELRRECAGLLRDGRPRSRKDVAWSLQRYLIFGILSCIPDRQRTLRELEVGRMLVKEDGRWCIRHGPRDYKTGRTYGDRPPLIIAPSLYPELEAFVSTWRAELAPQHGFLFTQENGEPFSDKSLYKTFWQAAYRITGKRFTPHMVRDSCVTYLRGKGNASERELEALALYMGHSIEMQRGSYDRRTKEEKVGPAVALLESLNVQAGEG